MNLILLFVFLDRYFYFLRVKRGTLFKKNYRNLFIYTYIAAVLIVFISTIYMFSITKKSDITKISIENLKSKIDEREQFLNSYLNFYRNTLFSLKYSNNFIEYLDYNLTPKTISNHFLNFAELLNEVAMIKYIDSIGFEK